MARLALACGGFVANPVLAAPGDPDPAFGTAGQVNIDIGYSFREGTSVAAQSDGKYLVSAVAWGWETFGSPMVRFNADHSIDTTYGYQGQADAFGIKTSVKIVADQALVAENVYLWVPDAITGSFYRDILIARYGSDGRTDTTFGVNGRTPTFNAGLGTGGEQRFNDFAVAPDGKLVAVGYTNSTSGNTSLLVVRYNANGTLDTGFGTSGIFKFDVPTVGASYQELRGVTVLADGRILAVGYAGSPRKGVVVLINVAGTTIDNFLAPSFYVNSGGNPECNAVVTASASRSIVACTEGLATRATIFAVDASGNIDTGFNGGAAAYDLGTAQSGFRGLTVAGDGKIYAVGYAGPGELAVMAFQANGTQDTSFGVSGVYITPEPEYSNGAGVGIVGSELVATGSRNGPDSDIVVATFTRATGVRTSAAYYKGTSSTNFGGVAVLGDGRIMIGGTTGLGNVGNYLVTRLQPSGAVDTTYGVTGYSTLAIPNLESNTGVRDLVMQPDGMALVTGPFGGDSVRRHRVGAARLSASGAGDPAFNASGTPGYNFVDTGADSGTFTFGRSVRLQSDGKVLAAGSGLNGSRQPAVARFNSNGTVDSGFGVAGVAMTAFGGNTTGRAMDLGADGKIVITGGNGNDIRVARFTSSGILDSAFGTSGTKAFTVPTGYTLLLPNRIFVLSSGKVLVVASVNTVSGFGAMAVKLNADGSLDTGFGGGRGWSFVEAISGAGATGNFFGATIAPNGKVIAVGFSSNGVTASRGTVVRMNADGSADTLFGSSGVLTYTYPRGQFEFNAVKVAPDGSLAIGGRFGPNIQSYGAVLKTVADASTLVPAPPTLLSATAGIGQVTIAFAPPEFSGSSAITGYTVTCNPGGVTTSGASSPITVTGLTNGVSYTCTVAATSAAGTGSSSATSVSFAPGALPTVTMSTTQSHTLALDATGKVFGWGSDSYGQLGQGRAINRLSPAQVAGLSGIAHIAFAAHGLAVDAFRQVWSWGDNSCGGQLGPRESSVTSKPSRVIGATNVTKVAAGGCFSLARKADGTLWGWGEIPGYGTDAGLRQIGGLSGIAELAAGTSHALLLRNDQTVLAFGDNSQGELGLGTTGAAQPATLVPGLAGVTAIAARQGASMALSSGQIYFWGKRATGAVVSSPTALPPAGGAVVAIALADNVPYAVRSDGLVYQFDAASSTWLPVSAFSGMAGLSASGELFALGVGTGGQLFAAGSNQAGQLGEGDTNVHAGSLAVPGFASTAMVAVSGLTPSVLALKSDGSVWFWGADTLGQSGDAGVIGSSVPQMVTIPATLKAIATGNTFSAALDTVGNVWGWGDNRKGAFGSSLVNRSTAALIGGVSNVQAIAAGGDGLLIYLLGDGSVKMSGALPPLSSGLDPATVSGLGSITAIAAGGSAYALRNDNVLFGWGGNASGELGNASTVASATPVQVQGITGTITRIAAGEHRAAAVTSDGKVWVWGAAIAGTFAGSATAVAVPGITDAADVTIGSGALYVKRQGGGLFVWGGTILADAVGQNLAQPYAVAFPQAVHVIRAGARHDLAFVIGNTGLAWGFGSYGDVSTSSAAIGDGAYVPRDRPVVLLAPGGTGSTDGNDWYLDLDASTAETIPAGSTPKALGVSRLFGSDAGLSLDATVKYKSADYGKAVNNYVFALVPAQFFAQVANAAGTPPVAEIKAIAQKRAGYVSKDEVSVLAQLTPSGWSFVQAELIAYSQSVANAQGGALNILNTVDASQIPGGRFCIGYGESSGSMLTFEALREVLLLPGASSNLSGVPCVLTGLYMDGPASSRAGSSVTFKGSVVGLGPTGTMQFTDGAGPLGAATTLGASNQAVSNATVSTSALALGVHSIGAAYGGDSKNAAVRAEIPLVHEVVAAPPGQSVTVLSGNSGSDVGSLVVFSVSVAGDLPTGSVQFKDGAGNLGDAVPLVGGVATLRTSSLGLGAHSISAAYSGNGTNAPSTSNVLTHMVYAAITTQVSITSSVNPSTSAQPVTFTATVSGNNPTGSVTFRDGGTTLSQTTLVNGVASYTVGPLAPGAHQVTAQYSGDGNNQAVTSLPIYQLVSVPQTTVNPPRLGNISTRMQVLTGNDVMIAGFIIGGNTPKTVVISVAGPSLVPFGIANALTNPTLTLVRSSDQAVLKTNDNWQTQAIPGDAAAIQGTGFAPNNASEPAIIATLPPGAYTAIVQGAGGTSGVGLVGVFEVDHFEVPLINISTRGQVLTGNDVMIAGFIIQGNNPQTVVINVAGPSLVPFGIPNALMNPTLTLVRSSDQAVLKTNDNWQTQTNPADVAAIQAAGFQPNNAAEPAIIATLPPGAYTAIVQGVGGSTGVGLVGVFTAP